MTTEGKITTTTTITTTSTTMSTYQEFSNILRSNIFPSVGGEWKTSTGSTYINHHEDIKVSGDDDGELAHDTTHCRHKDWLGINMIKV